MPRKNQKLFAQISKFVMLSLGIAIILISAVYDSYFAAILGVTLIFWGIILFYITPMKQVPLTLLNASADSKTSNIERILTEFNLNKKGIYLPPKNLGNIESSLIFVPKSNNSSLPVMVHEENQMLIPETRDGVFLTPPGYALSILFEKELGSKFIRVNIEELPIFLSKLLVEKFELAQNLEVLVNKNIVVIKTTGNIFSEICMKTDFTPLSHGQIGCLFSSSLACVLAKVTGKPIVIQSETQIPETKSVVIEFKLIEE